MKKIFTAALLAMPLLLRANTDPAVVSSIDSAKTILDNWRGDRAQLDKARSLIMAALERDRDYSPAFVQLSRLERKAAYQSFSNYAAEGLQRSEKFAQHAIKLDPKNGSAYISLAWVQIDEKDYDRARASIDSGEQAGARAIDVREARADIARAEGDPKTALKLMNEILTSRDATQTDRAYAYSVIAPIYANVGDVDQADRAYKEILKLLPDDAWTHGNYAYFLLKHDRIDDAITESERAVKLMPYPLALSTLARAYIAKADALWDAGDHAKAADYIDKVGPLAGNNAELYYAIGLTYERAAKRTGDQSMLARAEASFRKALAINPQYAAAQQELNRLKK